MLKFFYCFFFVVFTGTCATAQLAGNFYLYEDSAKKISAQTAFDYFKNGKFSRPPKNEVNEGYTRSVFWLAYINDTGLPPDSLLLQIGNCHINIIQVFFSGDDKTIFPQWTSGDYYPFSQRPVNATGFYFPINSRGIYLARIDKSNESLQLSFNIVSKMDALAKEANNKIVMSLFTGIILLLIIFGIYLFIISRDSLYIFYILYIATAWLWVLSNAGYGFEYLWPRLPWFASKARPVFVLAPLLFSLVFLLKFIGGIKNKKVRIAINIMNGILIACILSILQFNEHGYQSKWWLYIQYFIPLVALLYILITVTILITFSIKGNRLAIFYLVAIMALLISGILQVSFSLGRLNAFGSFFNNFGLSVGYVTEVIILTAGLVYRFNQYKIDKENILVEMNKRQVENSRVLIEVQEAERSQVANQLHDVAGSLLSAAKLNLSSLRENKAHPGSKENDLLQKTEEAVDTVANMVRNLSHALSPVMVEQVGFITSLQKVISIFNASGKIHIELITIGFNEFNPSRNIYYTTLYSIIYELLNNVAKHSNASNVLLQVSEYSDLYTLIIEDDGEGSHDVETKRGVGIATIQSRVNYFNGAIAFDQSEVKGLIITIEIPITNET